MSIVRCCADILRTYISRDIFPQYILLRFSPQLTYGALLNPFPLADNLLLCIQDEGATDAAGEYNNRRRERRMTEMRLTSSTISRRCTINVVIGHTQEGYVDCLVKPEEGGLRICKH